MPNSIRYAALTLPLLALVAACSKAPTETTATGPAESGSAQTASADATASAAGQQTAPAIDPNVAPGVAFDARYGFTLPENQIAVVQERHAGLCARLGAAHCRVTALQFTKQAGGAVNAMMAFKLDPAMALRFAGDATAMVEQADGTLSTSEVNGKDVGSEIVAGDKSADGLRAELAKIDAQLRIPGLGNQARADLVQRAAELREQLRALASDRDGKVESLATTPVLFDYTPATSIFGFRGNSPLQQGLSASTSSLSALFSLLALVIGTLGPWALLLGALWWLIARLRRPAAVAE